MTHAPRQSNCIRQHQTQQCPSSSSRLLSVWIGKIAEQLQKLLAKVIVESVMKQLPAIERINGENRQKSWQNKCRKVLILQKLSASASDTKVDKTSKISFGVPNRHKNKKEKPLILQEFFCGLKPLCWYNVTMVTSFAGGMWPSAGEMRPDFHDHTLHFMVTVSGIWSRSSLGHWSVMLISSERFM